MKKVLGIIIVLVIFMTGSVLIFKKQDELFFQKSFFYVNDFRLFKFAFSGRKIRISNEIKGEHNNRRADHKNPHGNTRARKNSRRAHNKENIRHKIHGD